MKVRITQFTQYSLNKLSTDPAWKDLKIGEVYPAVYASTAPDHAVKVKGRTI